MTVPRPNVVVIYTDDLGFGDVGFTGGEGVQTPHLDALAASGATMGRWYANSPVCSPSRAALLTGRHPARAGVSQILGAKRGMHGLPAQETLATRLSAAGYETALVGKWHLGTSAESSPAAHGFRSFFGFLAGCVDYYSHIMYWDRANPLHDLWVGAEETWRNGEYLTTMITDAAVEFLERVSEPSFLFVSYNAPHYPLHAPAEYVSRFDHLPPDRRMIAAMIAAVDDGVGRIVETLERLGRRDDTIVFFSSDNGPSAEERNWLGGEEIAFAGGSAGGLRGHKGSLFEGGIRVPTCWSWPGMIPAGVRLDLPAQMSDVAPTVLAAAGVPYQDVDGTALMGALAGDDEPERLLLWEYDGQSAASDGTWKLIRHSRDHLGGSEVEAVGLYRLDSDEQETTNLFLDSHPEALRLGAELDRFEADLRSWGERIAQSGQYRDLAESR